MRWALLLKKQKGSDKCPKRSVSRPITKDEEEVAETLYALAEMFSNKNSSDKSKQDYESSGPKPLDLPEAKDNHRPAFEGFEMSISVV